MSLGQRDKDVLASRYGDMLGSGGGRYTPASADDIAAMEARLRKRGAQTLHGRARLTRLPSEARIVAQNVVCQPLPACAGFYQPAMPRMLLHAGRRKQKGWLATHLSKVAENWQPPQVLTHILAHSRLRLLKGLQLGRRSARVHCQQLERGVSCRGGKS